MHPLASVFIKIALLTAAFSSWSEGIAQNQTVSGDLTVDGVATILNGPLSLGVAQFDGGSPVAGLTIVYDDIAQTGSGGSYIPGQSTLYQLAAQALAEFHWQYTDPTTGAQDLMLLSNEALSIVPSIQGLGVSNILPNQTLSAGGTSILTKTLADGLYLSSATDSSGAFVIPNALKVTGSLYFSALGSNIYGHGTDNRLPNQVADHNDSILTKRLADNLYLQVPIGEDKSFQYGYMAYATPSDSVALGSYTRANTYAISIGRFAGSDYGIWASGIHSISMGYAANASGSNALSLGRESAATQLSSIAIGASAEAITNYSVAIGVGTVAARHGQVAIGSYNSYQSLNLTADPSDDIFVIGNGVSIYDRSNAFSIKRNGDTEIKGKAKVAGDLDVQGVIRTHAAGDVSMGPFTSGPTPP